MIVLFPLPTQASSVTDWAKNVIASEDQPQWKKSLAIKVVDGNVKTFLAKTTRYSDKDYLDPGTGGGPRGCTWTNPDWKRLNSVVLRPGFVAADLRHHPTGTVMYAGKPFERSWIVADCGPGVKGYNRIDVYHAGHSDWNWYAKNVAGPVKVWVLGRISRDKALM